MKPPRVEIQVLTVAGRWKVMVNEEPSDDIDLELVPWEIRGFKVIMMDMDKNSAEKEGEVGVYGIKKIEVSRPGSALSLESCGA